jgi:hypothetical protein
MYSYGNCPKLSKKSIIPEYLFDAWEHEVLRHLIFQSKYRYHSSIDQLIILLLIAKMIQSK